MKIDLKKLIKKILDHRKDPKIFVAVFTILLSCISFGYCSLTPDYTYNNIQADYLGFGNELLGTDSFICLDISNFGYDTFSSFRLYGMSSNGEVVVFSLIGNPGQITTEGHGDLVCGFVPDYIEYFNGSFNSNNISILTFYQYAIGLSSCSSCESDLSTCQSSLSSCQSNASSLYQDLSSCSNSLSNCQSSLNSCQGYLSGCQSDLNSASGYVSSLESELNQCSQDLINCSNSSNTGSCETGSNWSALYINDIQHLGKPNIFITIPEEINWTYTSEGDDFDLNVSGYNVDTEYIENVIDIQNTKPTQDDFNKIISEVIPLFIPGLFIVLFIYFVFRFVKKVF